jgi:hypothetical protein
MRQKMLSRFMAAVLMMSLAGAASAHALGGKFYGVHWDGSQEHFVTLDPVTGVHTSLAVVPGVQWIDASFRVFDPDSGLFAFVGGGAGDMKYQIIDAATGAVVQSFPRTDNLKNPMYNPGTGLLYGTWWSDSTPVLYDSLGRRLPVHHQGTEYFAIIDPRTGARTDTPIPGVSSIAASSAFLDTDSGRYVFQGMSTGGPLSYYVLDVTTGALVTQLPIDIRLDFPVYNPVLNAVHGLWWSDSTVRDTVRFDTLGRPVPPRPPVIKGTEYFVTVHQDSTVTMVELPGVKYIANLNRALDTDSGRYVFTGSENGGTIRYYVIDVATGAILSNTAASGRAVDHIVYAPLRSTSYGNVVSVTRGAAGARSAAWSMRQSGGMSELLFSNPDGKPHTFALVDLSGKTVLRREGIRTERVSFATGGLKPGVYGFILRGAQGGTTAGKIMLK